MRAPTCVRSDFGSDGPVPGTESTSLPTKGGILLDYEIVLLKLCEEFIWPPRKTKEGVCSQSQRPIWNRGTAACYLPKNARMHLTFWLRSGTPPLWAGCILCACCFYLQWSDRLNTDYNGKIAVYRYSERTGNTEAWPKPWKMHPIPGKRGWSGGT